MDTNITQKKKAKRGRPKCFDEQEALEKAMLLFWANGYIATSISDLTKALGITAPSLYGCFGDKASLFNLCIDYYLTHEACPVLSIMKQAKTAKVAVELLLYDAVKRFIQPDKPLGCMLVTSTMGHSDQIQHVQHKVLEKKSDYKVILMARLRQGVSDGDLAAVAPIEAISDFYITVINGLSIQACDGVGLEALNQVVFNAIKAWAIFDR